jgi:hypothetical protein
MSRRVPLNSPEGRRLVERGPAWREHPDYYRDEPDDDEPIPWFTDQHAREAAERIRAYALGQPGYLKAKLDTLSDAELLNVARICLELRPR